ncbi:MAG: TolC family outer membrane protein [Pseudomonadota bacterium]|nr:TolC family outer membrane protein [Pseudomonadota bacterium]
MLRKFIFLALMAGCAFSVFPMTLEEAVRTTLSTNPDIAVSRQSAEAQGYLARQSKAGIYPSIEIGLAGGWEQSNNTTTRATGVESLDLSRTEKSIRLTQRLFDGHNTRELIKQQASLTEAALARQSNTEEAVSLRAVQVYLEMLRRRAVVSLTEENLGHHDTTLNKISERYESGLGTRVDVVQTEGRRAQSKSNVLLAMRDVANGRAEFFRVVGEQPTNLSLPDNVSGLPSTLNQALTIAKDNNPELQAATAEYDAARSADKSARGSIYPRVDLELGVSRNDDTDGTIGANEDEIAMVRLTYNLYRGGAEKARRSEASARMMAAQESLRSAQRQLDEDVTLVWNELQDILLRLEYLEAHVAPTEEVLQVYNEQLSLGKRTLLDLLDVQNELLRAKVALTAGQFYARLARYRLLASTGQLLENLNVR